MKYHPSAVPGDLASRQKRRWTRPCRQLHYLIDRGIEHHQILVGNRFNNNLSAVEGYAVDSAAAVTELLDNAAGEGDGERVVLRVRVGDPAAVAGDFGAYDLRLAGDEGPLTAGAKFF